MLEMIREDGTPMLFRFVMAMAMHLKIKPKDLAKAIRSDDLEDYTIDFTTEFTTQSLAKMEEMMRTTLKGLSKKGKK